jgi:IclR family KDG regulon transcriptional repressor
MSGYIKLVETTINALKILSDAPDGIGVREIGRLLELNKSTCHRLLLTLRNEGLVEFDELSQKYLMTLGILQLTNKVQQKNNLISSSLPHMEKLRDLTNETVALHIRVLDHRIAVSKVESNFELRWSPLIGKSYPLYLGAASRVIAAHMSAELTEDLLTSLPDHIDRLEFVNSLEEIRSNQICISRGEIESGGVGIASPIMDIYGNLQAAISIYALENRLTNQGLEEYKREVRATALLISKSLH